MAEVDKVEVEVEVFRITTEIGDKYYEYAESTRSKGKWPDQRRFTTNKLLYVGKLIKIITGGYGDNGWKIVQFQDNNGQIQTVNYSYEGNTCFREVSSLPKNIIEE